MSLEPFGELELPSDTLTEVIGGIKKKKEKALSAVFTSACLKKVTSVEAL